MIKVYFLKIKSILRLILEIFSPRCVHTEPIIFIPNQLLRLFAKGLHNVAFNQVIPPNFLLLLYIIDTSGQWMRSVSYSFMDQFILYARGWCLPGVMGVGTNLTTHMLPYFYSHVWLLHRIWVWHNTNVIQLNSGRRHALHIDCMYITLISQTPDGARPWDVLTRMIFICITVSTNLSYNAYALLHAYICIRLVRI